MFYCIKRWVWMWSTFNFGKFMWRHDQMRCFQCTLQRQCEHALNWSVFDMHAFCYDPTFLSATVVAGACWGQLCSCWLGHIDSSTRKQMLSMRRCFCRHWRISCGWYWQLSVSIYMHSSRQEYRLVNSIKVMLAWPVWTFAFQKAAEQFIVAHTEVWLP